MTVKVGILGAAGRMGQAVAAEVAASGLTLAGRADAGDDAATVFAGADAVIDFAAPGATARYAGMAAAAKTAYVVGTTGLTEADHAALTQAGKDAPVLQAGNFSLGVNLMAALAEGVAGRLKDDWDIDILEMHHRHKVDAPSGTALLLGEAVARGRGVGLETVARRSRDGVIGARPAGEIGFATLRGGGVIGEHSVIFASPHERLTLSHHAEDRGLFAAGAVAAAHWLVQQPAGRYAMADMLQV